MATRFFELLHNGETHGIVSEELLAAMFGVPVEDAEKLAQEKRLVTVDLSPGDLEAWLHNAD